MGKYSDFPSQNPKWDQNLQFTLQSEMMSILVTFTWDSPPPGLFLYTGNKISFPADHPPKTKDTFGFLGIYL